MTKLKQNTYRNCPECGKDHYHQMVILTDMEKVVGGELSSYTTEFTCHGCRSTYLTTRTVDKQPQHSCCGETEDLEAGYAGNNLIYLCPNCEYEAEHPGM